MTLDKRYIIFTGLIGLTILFSGGYWQTMFASEVKESFAVDSSKWKSKLTKEEGRNFAGSEENTLDLLLNAMKKIQTQVTGLTQQVGTVRKEIDFLTLTSAQANLQGYDESAESLVMTEEELSEKAEQQRLEEEIAFEERFLSESVEPKWSHLAEEKTLTALSSVSDRLSVLDIECKRSMCRLHIAREQGVTDDGSVFDALETGVNWDGEMYVTYDPESGEGKAYLARLGYSLSDSVDSEG